MKLVAGTKKANPMDPVVIGTHPVYIDFSVKNINVHYHLVFILNLANSKPINQCQFDSNLIIIDFVNVGIRWIEADKMMGSSFHLNMVVD